MSLLLGACASTGASKPSTYEERYNAEVDTNKVATVAQWAQTHGATVVWLHYPPRPAERDHD
jgi:hypothetical protein